MSHKVRLVKFFADIILVVRFCPIGIFPSRDTFDWKIGFLIFLSSIFLSDLFVIADNRMLLTTMSLCFYDAAPAFGEGIEGAGVGAF